jgi:hypothetical protein
MVLSDDGHSALELTEDAVPNTFGEKVSAFWRGITNPMSVISLLVLGSVVASLGVGHWLFYLMVDSRGVHNINIPGQFFAPGLGLMFIYVACYGYYFETRRSLDANFDAGYVSPRTILRLTAVLTATAFGFAGYEILGLSWYPSYQYGLFCLFGVPGTAIAYALAHGWYVTFTHDLRSHGRRRGSKNTRVLLTSMTAIAFLYNFYFCAHSGDLTLVFWSIMLVFGSPIACIITWLCYDSCVSKDADRGLNFG